MWSRKKANAVSNGILLIGFAILIITDAWWPHALLVAWLTITVRQYFTGRITYAVLTTFIMLGLYITALLKFDWDFLAPALLAVAGIFLITKELWFDRDENPSKNPEQTIEDAKIDG